MYRGYLPKDLKPVLRNHDLNGSIVVQAAPTIEETSFLLSLAEQTETILGMVGWLDLFDPKHRTHYEMFRRHSKFVGFRIMIQEMSNAQQILEPRFVDAIRWYSGEDIPVDLLLRENQLEPVVRLLELVPGLRGVINHIAKPRIVDDKMEPWLKYMRQIAEISNIYCKLSGMVTEANPKLWRPDDFTFYIQNILTLFGEDRVMFRSDWPVCLLAATYDDVMALLLRSLPETFGPRERTKLFGENAYRFYKLGQKH